MDDNTNELRTQAVALREAGRTRDQIRRELGLKSDWALIELLDREPARHPGLRARAKDDFRQRARELRDEGKTYPEIAAELGVSKSSVSLWVRDLPSPTSTPEGKARAQERRTAGVRKSWQKKQQETDVQRQKTKESAARQIGALGDREILVAGALVYWCEGAKSKPWRTWERVVFTNSDPGLITFFIRFLRAAGAEHRHITYRLSIHESADVERAVGFWAKIVGEPPESFLKTLLKKHNPKTVRKNVGDDYHGCLIVSVNQSAWLYRKIEGWARAAMGVAIVER